MPNDSLKFNVRSSIRLSVELSIRCACCNYFIEMFEIFFHHHHHLRINTYERAHARALTIQWKEKRINYQWRKKHFHLSILILCLVCCLLCAFTIFCTHWHHHWPLVIATVHGQYLLFIWEWLADRSVAKWNGLLCDATTTWCLWLCVCAAIWWMYWKLAKNVCIFLWLSSDF